AQIRRQEREAGNPRRDRSCRGQEFVRRAHAALENEPDAQDEREIQGEDGPIDGAEMNAQLGHHGISQSMRTVAPAGPYGIKLTGCPLPSSWIRGGPPAPPLRTKM